MKPKNITILFVEFPGFSGLSSNLPSKEFNALLKECYEFVDSSVRLHQGKLSNFLGNSFMAVFFAEKSNTNMVLEAIGAMIEFRESKYQNLQYHGHLSENLAIC